MLELMVTMAIMASLLGLGAGMFLTLGKRSGEQQAIAAVSQIVTKARNASNRFPATIVPDPAEGKIMAFTDEVLQELHFDPRPLDGGKSFTAMGIEGLTCTITGGVLDEKGGRVGGAAKLSGGGIDCGNFAVYDVRDGISAEAWIKPVDSPKCDIISKGQVFRVSIESPGRGNSKLKFSMKLQSPDGRQEPFEKSVAIPRVRPNEWFGVRASFDRREVVLESNDGFGWTTRMREVFEKEEDRRRVLARDEQAQLRVGAGLVGWIDDVRIGGIRSSEPVQVPAGMSVLPGRSIRFVNGRLDSTVHTGIERISIRAQGRTLQFEIGQDGSILDIVESEALPDAAGATVRPVVKTPVPEKKE